MKSILIGLAIFASMSAFANETIPVNATEFIGSIDQAFFDQCLKNIEKNDENTQKCKVFESPNGSVILRDGEYMSSLRNLVKLSESRCSLVKGVYGSLYLHTNDTSIELVMEDTNCLKVMNKELKKQNFPQKNRSIFIFIF